MEWRKKLFALLQQQFCNPTDDIEAKRKQCVLVATMFVFAFVGIVGRIHGFVVGTFKNSPNYVPIFIDLACLVHCRVFRNGRSARLYFATALSSNFINMYYRNGFLFTPHYPFVGMVVPILASFLSEHPQEPYAWTFLWMLSNGMLFVLEKHSLLPAYPLSPGQISVSNFLMASCVAGFLLLLSSFILFVYLTEVEARQTLEKDFSLFMRLSHEIRTPVAIMVASAELMRELGGTLNPEQNQTLANLLTASRRLSSVVSNILAFSAMEYNHFANHGKTNGLETAVVRFNIRQVMDTVIGYHLDAAEQAGLSIYLDIPPDASIDVKGEKGQLECVLDQLVNNAVKFTPTGSIEVKVRILDPIVLGNSSSQFEFEVTDTGVGISANELQKMFRPFCQLGVALTAGEGLGLGLAVANRMVQRLGGGSITAKSLGPGHGSTFSFQATLQIFPCSGSASVSSQIISLPKPLSHISTVASGSSDSVTQQHSHDSGLPMAALLVDDEPRSVRTVTQSFNIFGVAVQQALMAEATPDRCKAFGVIIITSSAKNLQRGSNSSSTRTSLDRLLEMQCALQQFKSECLPPMTHLVVLGSSLIQPWVQSVLKCHFLRTPPSLTDVGTLCRALFAPKRSFNACSKPGASHHQAATTHPLMSPELLIQIPLATASCPIPDLNEEIPPVCTSVDSLMKVGTPREEDEVTNGRLAEQVPADDPNKNGQGVPLGLLPLSTLPTLLPIRILVVDDNAVIVKLLNSILSSAFADSGAGPLANTFRPNPISVPPVVIDTAGNGEEALAKIVLPQPPGRAMPYDLVFCDFNMPVMDGMELTHRIRAHEGKASDVHEVSVEASRMPIIGLTAAANMAPLCLDAGMDEVITKPFTKAQIVDVVRRYVCSK